LHQNQQLNLLKQLSAFVLLVALLAQTYSKAFVVFHYYINTTSFAKNCVNKAQPTMHCNGQCQLMKKLKQKERTESKAPESKGENKDETLSSKSFFSRINISSAATATVTYFTVNDKRVVKMPRSIFHPPGM
jgi:hypothetical protein